MINLIRTDSENADFRKLVNLLDMELKKRDGEAHSFFAQFNKLDHIHHVVVAYQQNEPVGCGAIKKYADDTAEVKRMFVEPSFRGKGVASSVLSELEKWAKELNYDHCRLETTNRQPEALALYRKAGYKTIPNYGQYAGVESSECMEKTISSVA